MSPVVVKERLRLGHWSVLVLCIALTLIERLADLPTYSADDPSDCFGEVKYPKGLRLTWNDDHLMEVITVTSRRIAFV